MLIFAMCIYLLPLCPCCKQQQAPRSGLAVRVTCSGCNFVSLEFELKVCTRCTTCDPRPCGPDWLIPHLIYYRLSDNQFFSEGLTRVVRRPPVQWPARPERPANLAPIPPIPDTEVSDMDAIEVPDFSELNPGRV